MIDLDNLDISFKPAEPWFVGICFLHKKKAEQWRIFDKGTQSFLIHLNVILMFQLALLER